MGFKATPVIQRYDLSENGRHYTKEEIEAERNAVSFPVNKFKRIKPVPGTLSFLLRDFKGGNEAVYQFISEQIKETKLGISEKIKRIIILYRNADENSQNRPDIFDHLCEEVGLIRKKFWGYLQEALYEHTEMLTRAAISAHKPILVQDIAFFSRKKENFADRKLLANITKLTEPAPLVKVTTEDNRVMNVFGSFNDISKKSDEIIRGTPEPRQLSEGETEFIEGELLEEREKQTVRRKGE